LKGDAGRDDRNMCKLRIALLFVSQAPPVHAGHHENRMRRFFNVTEFAKDDVCIQHSLPR